MYYMTVTEFTNTYNVSKPTLYRFYRKHPEIHSETKFENNRRLIPKKHFRYFDIEALKNENIRLREENQILKSDNKSMKNLVYNLIDKESFGYQLWYMDWTFFVTVSYDEPRSQNYCHRSMSGLYNSMNETFGHDSAIRMFFTTEKHETREGYHSHAVIYVENPSFEKQAKELIEKRYSSHRLDIQKYARTKGGVFYMQKEGLSGEDWDFLYNSYIRLETS